MSRILIRIITNFIFPFFLLFLFLVCIYQHAIDQSLYKSECKKIDTPEAVWQGQPYGDLMAYDTFLIENVFKDYFTKNTLVIPFESRLNPKYSLTYDLNLFSAYLFPINIEENDNYEFNLEENTFNKLIKLPLIKRSYRRNWNSEHYPRDYYLIKGLEAKDYKKWGLYIFINNKEVNIFTLPMGWDGLKN